MKKIILIAGALFGLLRFAEGQIVNIPDAIFKNYLINHSSINTNGDGEIQVSEAATFSDTIDVEYMDISDLTGIEAFTDLTVLVCWYNQLTSLNISSNMALTKLECFSNKLTSLDVSANTALTVLNCGYNQLTSLDVSTNTALTVLYCHSNQLTSLDVSANTALTVLFCSYNQLTSLNLSANTALTSLGCQSNQLTNLNLSANTALTNLYCSYNQLTSLNVKNGNNTNFTNFNSNNNPNLTCIQVDNAAYMNANWSSDKDSTANFSANCGIGINESSIFHLPSSIFPNPFSSNFTIHYFLEENSFVSLKLFDVTGKLVSEIANEQQMKGEHRENIDGRKLADGIYYFQMVTDEGTETRKIVKQ